MIKQNNKKFKVGDLVRHWSDAASLRIIVKKYIGDFNRVYWVKHNNDIWSEYQRHSDYSLEKIK